MPEPPTFIFVEGVGRVRKSEEALFKVDMDEYDTDRRNWPWRIPGAEQHLPKISRGTSGTE